MKPRNLIGVLLVIGLAMGCCLTPKSGLAGNPPDGLEALSEDVLIDSDGQPIILISLKQATLDKLVTQTEAESTAAHEAGHAILAHHAPDCRLERMYFAILDINDIDDSTERVMVSFRGMTEFDCDAPDDITAAQLVRGLWHRTAIMMAGLAGQLHAGYPNTHEDGGASDLRKAKEIAKVLFDLLKAMQYEVDDPATLAATCPWNAALEILNVQIPKEAFQDLQAGETSISLMLQLSFRHALFMIEQNQKQFDTLRRAYFNSQKLDARALQRLLK